MKSYSIQQKPCQFFAEGCSYQLQRYKNNLKKQMSDYADKIIKYCQSRCAQRAVDSRSISLGRSSVLLIGM